MTYEKMLESLDRSFGNDGFLGIQARAAVMAAQTAERQALALEKIADSLENIERDTREMADNARWERRS